MLERIARCDYSFIILLNNHCRAVRDTAVEYYNQPKMPDGLIAVMLEVNSVGCTCRENVLAISSTHVIFLEPHVGFVDSHNDLPGPSNSVHPGGERSSDSRPRRFVITLDCWEEESSHHAILFVTALERRQ